MDPRNSPYSPSQSSPSRTPRSSLLSASDTQREAALGLMRSELEAIYGTGSGSSTPAHSSTPRPAATATASQSTSAPAQPAPSQRTKYQVVLANQPAPPAPLAVVLPFRIFAGQALPIPPRRRRAQTKPAQPACQPLLTHHSLRTQPPRTAASLPSTSSSTPTRSSAKKAPNNGNATTPPGKTTTKSTTSSTTWPR